MREDQIDTSIADSFSGFTNVNTGIVIVTPSQRLFELLHDPAVIIKEEEWRKADTSGFRIRGPA